MSIQYKAYDPLYGRRPWSGGLGSGNPSVVLACSVANPTITSIDRIVHPRRLCEDRKGFVDHLYPLSLTKSSLRIVIMQSSAILTHYMNDQLKEDIRRDELVAEGKLSVEEAEEEAAEWSEREWAKQWAAYPEKVMNALAKYHCIILVMRLYERIADSFVDKVAMDALTIDTFDYAKRASQSATEKSDLGRDVFKTSLKANLISYLADFSVHQVILLYGYYVYVQSQRRKLQYSSREKALAEKKTLAVGLLKKSSLLFVSRGFALVMSSIGAAVCSCLYPGWGTLLGANLGDGLAMTVSDEFISLSPPIA